MNYLNTVAKIIRALLYTALIAGALWALFGLFARKDYLIERQIAIAAPLELVYDQVRYFRNFRAWSPWASMDAAIRIEGPDGTPGAVFHWMSEDEEVGTGRQTLKSLSPHRIDFEINLQRPYATTSPMWFTFDTTDGQTIVKWYYHMYIGYPWNGLAMLTDVNAGVGKDFARGLENLKRHCEIMVPRTYNGYEVREEEHGEQLYVGFRQTVPIEQVEIFLEAHFQRIAPLIRKRSLLTAGPMTALLWIIDSLHQQADVAAAVPITTEQKVPSSLQAFPMEGGLYCWVELQGPPDLSAARKALSLYADEKGMVPVPPLQVEYTSRPPQVRDTAQWITRVRQHIAAPPPTPPNEEEMDTSETENGEGQR